jgi:predicted nucleotidyltransferase
VVVRLEDALQGLVRGLSRIQTVVGVVLFGSFARGDYGRNSDLDLLVLLDDEAAAESGEAEQAVLKLVGELESEWALPMHLSPMFATIRHPEQLGQDLLHDIWRDGVVLYGEADALARLQPEGMAPWVLFRFSTTRMRPASRATLSRRLRGAHGRSGLVEPPGMIMGRGAVLVPGGQHRRIRDALDVAGATYDVIPVWRPV